MNVAEMIEWLQTMPQGATVRILEHHSGTGYYDQGGSVRVVDFDSEVEYVGLSGEWGPHYELSTYAGETVLQLGVTDK